MSVTLTIKFLDGSTSELPFAGQRTAEEFLAPLASRLDLTLARELFSYFAIDRNNICQLKDELNTLLAHINDGDREFPTLRSNVSQIVETLTLLESQEGWTASFG